MNHQRWDVIEELGQGGQGKVFRVVDRMRFNRQGELFLATQRAVAGLAKGADHVVWEKHFSEFRRGVVDVVRMEDPANQRALKVLHESDEARDAERARTRIKNEIKALSEVDHPNLVKVVDYDPDGAWFVTPYYPKGSLAKHPRQFADDFLGALKAWRPLVEAVSVLHGKNIVHRDIKPQNVFLGEDGSLVLGDFGLVFFMDEEGSRVSATWDNVGSRDWMPAWAMGRIEDIRPSFDVFCLGKLLWAMVAGVPKLRLWYYDRADYDIERMFPDSASVKFAKMLFSRTIVENEEDCLQSASALLGEIDRVLPAVERNCQWVAPGSKLACAICGLGMYEPIADENPAGVTNFGLTRQGSRSFKIFGCSHCGNVQFFSWTGDARPPAWSV